MSSSSLNNSNNNIEIKSIIKCFNGNLIRFIHKSYENKCNMTCAVYIPPQGLLLQDNSNNNSSSSPTSQIPAILYLSGLTCTDENVCQKSGIFRSLAENGIAFIAPDTSPRGIDIQGDSDSWDFGKGAGFYLDATNEPWSENYRMYSYIVNELPEVISNNFNSINMSKLSIMGHSMGGHGALTIAIKNQSKYQSVSAFSPICNPINSPWGQKAFTNYLGSNNENQWKEYDTCELLLQRGVTKYDNILIDFGLSDGFLNNQLKPNNLKEVAANVGQNITLREHEGYDHSYYFISTFIEDHVKYHSRYLF